MKCGASDEVAPPLTRILGFEHWVLRNPWLGVLPRIEAPLAQIWTSRTPIRIPSGGKPKQNQKKRE